MILCQRGAAWYELQEREKAIQDFDALLKINPTDEFALGLRGSCYLELSNYPQAVADLTPYAKLNPDPVVLATLAMAQFHTKDYDGAAHSAERVLESKNAPVQHRLMALMIRSDIFTALNKADEALQALSEAKQIVKTYKKTIQWPQGFSYYRLIYSLARCCHLNGQNEKALEYANEGLRLVDKSNIAEYQAVLEGRALIYLNLGKKTQALDDYKEILVLNPQDPHAADFQSVVDALQSELFHEEPPIKTESKSTGNETVKPKDTEQKQGKDASKQKEEAEVKRQIQEAREREQKRLQDRLQREEQKKQKEAEALAQAQTDKEIQRRNLKLAQGLPLSASSTKKALTVSKKEFNGSNDWWKNAAKMQELFAAHTAPLPSAPLPKQILEIVPTRPAVSETPKLAAVQSQPVSIAAHLKPTEFAYRPLPTLTGQPIVLNREDRNRLMTAQRMIKLGLEDLHTRAYGEKPYYDMKNLTHISIVKQGFLYYALRALEALHPTGRLLTQDDENFVALVNNFIADAKKVRELRHQIRNYPHLIELSSLVNFANLIKSGCLLQNIECLLNDKTFPKNPKPLAFGGFEFCSLKEKVEWDHLDPKVKTTHLLQLVGQEFKNMKSSIKPLGENKAQFQFEGEIQNALKMSIAIIGKCLTVLQRECGFRHPTLYKDIFKYLVKKSKDVSHKIGDDLEFYEFDEISPDIMFDIAIRAESLAAQFDLLNKELVAKVFK